MTLGGLALAVGILVDDATVEIENINRNLAMGKETVQAILDGAQQIAVPAFVSTLCICIVFIPMFFLSGVARYLFVPLAEAVILCDAGVVHVVADDRADDGDVSVEFGRRIPSRKNMPDEKHGIFPAVSAGVRAGLRAIPRWLPAGAGHGARAFASCFPRVSSGSACFPQAWIFVSGAATSFPYVDAGQIRLHLRARTGLRIEETRATGRPDQQGHPTNDSGKGSA